MSKKLLTILSVFLLFACASDVNTDDNHDKKEYIEPVKDVFVFDQLNTEIKNKIKKANNDKAYNNNQFKALGKKIFTSNVIDIYGNSYDLNTYNNIFLEVVSVDCSHCKNTITNYLEDIENIDAFVIQYFDVGDKQEIIDFYKELNIDMPTNIVILSHNDEIHSYLKDELLLNMYPSFVCFKNGNVSFVTSGELGDNQLDYLCDIGFVNTLNLDLLVDKDNKSIFDSIRDIRDVEKSLSKENIEKLNELDNDNHTKEYTLKLIGSKVDFDSISNDVSSIFINEVNDFSAYKQSKLVLIYTYLKDANDIDKVKFINELVNSNSDVEYLVVLIEGLQSSSNAYKQMDINFDCKVVSVLGYIPDDFFRLGISNYPTAFFIEDSTYTGAYSNISSVEEFKNAIDIFVGEHSIALKSNN